MLQEIMWYFTLKHQYELQKQQGAAGFFALLSTVFIIWQWDNIFFPIVQAIGLDKIAEAGGLVHTGSLMNGMQTFINITAFGFFILTCIGLLSAVPMALFLFAISTTKNVTSIFTKVLGLCLLPLLLIVFVLLWVLKAVGIMKEENNIHTHVKNNSELMTDNTFSKFKMTSVPKRDYLKVFAQEQSNKYNVEMNVSEMALKDATSYLNSFAKDFTEVRTLIGYKADKEAWFVLFQSPVPIHATKAFLNMQKYETGTAIDPLGFKSMTTDFCNRSENGNANYTDFYVPAEYCEVYYDPDIRAMRFTQKHNVATIINLTDLDAIFLMDGPLTKQLAKNSISNNKLLKDMMEDAIGLSIYLPLMQFRSEVTRYKNNMPGSYYRALKLVDGAFENFNQYQNYVLNVANYMVNRTHFSEARTVLNKLQTNEFANELQTQLMK